MPAAPIYFVWRHGRWTMERLSKVAKKAREEAGAVCLTGEEFDERRRQGEAAQLEESKAAYARLQRQATGAF